MGSAQLTGMHRLEAAAWVSERTDYPVTESVLRFWEAGGILREKHPGRRRPAIYGVHELVAACVVADLRRNGAPLQRVRRALHNLKRFLPDIAEKPAGAWRLAVLPNGDLVHLERDASVLRLTGQAGQGGFYFLEAGTHVRAAKKALRALSEAAA